MEKVVMQMQALAAASPREPSAVVAAAQQEAARDDAAKKSGGGGGGGNGSDLTSCNYCFGVSVYTRAMLEKREPPRCRGLELEVAAARDRVDAFKARAAAPREDEFTFLGIGVSVYSRAWMYEAKHMPLVKGLGVIAFEKDESAVMKAIEERKRVRRELERERRRQRGDVQDTDVDDDDDDDFDLVEELFGDDDDHGVDDSASGGADASALVEKTPLAGVGKPRLPPLLPVFTVEDFVGKSVESATYAAQAMVKFWTKRLDGFGERYVESCERLVDQMAKQATSVPDNCRWLLRQIEKTLSGGRGDGAR